MGSHTVRLDEEAEEALRELRSATGMTISQALKQGLVTLRQEVAKQRRPTPWEIYQKLDIGSGGYETKPPSSALTPPQG